MARQLWDNTINDSIDWSGDSNTENKPCTGRVVQEYIKDGVIKGKDAYNGRIGYTFFDFGDTNMLYGFNTYEDFLTWNGDREHQGSLVIVSADFDPLINGSITQVVITSLIEGGATTINVAKSAEHIYIPFSVTTQTKTIGATSWETIAENYDVQIFKDLGSSGTYVLAQTLRSQPQNARLTIDAKEYFSNNTGSHRVMIQATGLYTGKVGVKTFIVSVTSMALSPSNFNWWTPMFQSSVASYSFGGLKIEGSINKTLHCTITGSGGYTASYQKNLGTSTYISNAYYFKPDNLAFPSSGTGVYNVDLWLTSGELESAHLNYNIMCVSTEHVYTKRLICFNNFLSSAENYSTSNLLQFAIYNKGDDTGSPSIVIKGTYDSYTDRTIETLPPYTNINCGTYHTCTVTLSINTESQSGTIKAESSYGDTTISHTFPLDNTYVFPAISDYEFYMNPAGRTNTETQDDAFKKIKNEVNNVYYDTCKSATSRLSFIDGVDGWTTDEDGRKCFKVVARPNSATPITVETYKPLQGFNLGGTSVVPVGKTVEITFAVKNVANYDEKVIDISDSNGYGIAIKPNSVTILSEGDTDTEIQTAKFADEQTIHLIVSLIPKYNDTSKNLGVVFVNGVKNREFEIAEGHNNFGEALIRFGAQYSDLYIYNMRVYNRGFSYADALTNFLNSLANTTLKRQQNERITSDSQDWNITYDKAVASHNVMVVEMLNGADLPDHDHPYDGKTSTAWSNVEFRYHDHPEWNFKLYDVETTGQGTTSMQYYRWNLRFRIDKSNSSKMINIAYWENNQWGEPTPLKKVKFDGSNHIQIKRITAKKNFASSMQSHKMGTTAAFNDLHDAVVGKNDAQDNNSKVKVAVFQHPFYLFEYNTESGDYTFNGLYTAGPDKGDKPTFGYDDEDFETSLITLEGTDHDPVMARFAYPWQSQLVDVSASDEALGAKTGTSGFQKAWEVSNCGQYDISKSAQLSNVMTMLEQEWKPAYNDAYLNSPYLLPFPSTPAAANSDLVAFRALTASGIGYDNLNYRKYSEFEFWYNNNGNYEVYYYDLRSDTYVKNTEITSLKTDLNSYIDNTEWSAASTNMAKNDLFIKARIARFAATMTQHWDKTDSLFHYTFISIFGATDNFAKNSYPYKFKAFTNGGKWCWRQDDLDTIFDIDNDGKAVKNYFVEPTDWTDSSHSAHIYSGESSRFWTLIGMAFKSDIASMGYDILNAMSNLADSGSGALNRIMNFFQKYYWNKAQDYFSQTAYNADCEYSYEASWFAGWSGNGVFPLSQALGDHYLAEKLWVQRRMAYCMSEYGYGAFSSYRDTSLGQIAFRLNAPASFTITPAITLFPSVISGADSDVRKSSDRVSPSESWTSPSIGGNDTTFYFPTSDYYVSIGDLAGITTAETQSTPMSVSSKRLRTLKIGDNTASRTSTNNLHGLTLGSNPSIESIDARNLRKIGGEINLSGLPRITHAYLDNNGLTKSSYPSAGFTTIKFRDADTGAIGGSKLQVLTLPYTITKIDLTNLKFLTTLTLPTEGASNVVSLRLEGLQPRLNIDSDNDKENMFEIIHHVYTNSGNKFKYVRVFQPDIASNDWVEISAAILQSINNIAATNSGVHGITANGDNDDAAAPVIQGKAKLDVNFSSSLFSNLALGETHTTGSWTYQDSARLEGFRIYYKANKVYIVFAGTGVEALVKPSNVWGDGTGVTIGDAALLTEVASGIFTGNTIVNTLDELGQYFTSVQTIAANAFNGCTSFVSITLPSSLVTIGSNAFNGTKLANVTLQGSTLTSVDLTGCAMTGKLVLKNLTSLSAFTMSSVPNLTGLLVEGSTSLDSISGQTPFDILLKAYTSSTHSNFSRLRVMWDTDYNTGGSTPTQTALTMLSSIVNDISHATWKGYNASGSNINTPILAGTVTLGTIGLSDITTVEALQTAVTSFNSRGQSDGCNLTLLYDAAGIIITFEDSAVKALCVANWDTSGDGNISILEAQNVSSIGNVFRGNTSITSFNEFKYFTGVTSISGSTSSPYGAFAGCTTLSEISIPTSVTSIGAYAFRGCTSLENIVLSGSITFANYNGSMGIFYGCTSLETFDARNLTFINPQNTGGICQGCSKLKEVHLPVSYTGSNQAFAACYTDGSSGSGITDIHYYGTLDEYCNISITGMNPGVAYYNCAHNLVFPAPLLTSTSLLTGFTRHYYVNGNTVVQTSNISSITSTTIHEGLFGYATDLTGILTIPSSVTTIGSTAFAFCINITGLILSEGLQTIGSEAFFHCMSVTGGLTIPSTVTSLGRRCFGLGNGGNGTHLPFDYYHFLSIEPPTWFGTGWQSPFANTPATLKIYVGLGENADQDNAILNGGTYNGVTYSGYLNDSKWATASARMDTWYNYLHS